MNALFLDGKPGVVEYSEIGEEMKDAKTDEGQFVFNAANICVHYFSMDFLSKAVDKKDQLPVHLVKMKIPHVTEDGTYVQPDQPNGFKLEKFIFDVFQFADRDKFVVFECDREEEFEPLKNASGSGATPEMCLSRLNKLHAKWLLNAGAELVGPDGDSIIKEDLENKDVDELESIFKKVVVEISPKVSYDGEGLEKLVQGKMLSWPLYLSENKQYF